MSLPARPIRVLLAEDEDAVAALTQAVLAEERIEVVGRARDGHEAVALAEELSPDLVLMDIAMPELDGIEATRRIRELHPRVQVLVLSSSKLATDIERAAAAGAAGFVAKERMVRELIDAILALAPS